jgi:hypothetical protein
MSFNAFTVSIGYPLPAIDLYVMSSTGEIMNTRSNLEVRHNETNRFFVIPHNAAITYGPSFNYGANSNFMGNPDNNAYRLHYMINCTIAARPIENSGDYAFYATTTTKLYDQSTFINSIENSISYPQFNYKSVGSFGSNVAHFVVTNMSNQVLELSRASLVNGGDGSVPLVAQVMYVAAVEVSSALYNPPIYNSTVNTIFSQPFDIKYVAPLHRTLAY